MSNNPEICPHGMRHNCCIHCVTKERDRLKAEVERLRELLNGCGNHGCVIKRPSGMATNGPCRCRDRIAEALAQKEEK